MKNILYILLMLLLLTSGCKKNKGENIKVRDKNMDSIKEALIAKIREQPEAASLETEDLNAQPTTSPVVSLEDFFEGNEDLGSIGCNLIDHPGIDKFYKVLKEIRGQNNVQDVLIEINQIDEYLDWPFSEVVYILTSADKNDVAKWMRPLQPDEISEGWWYGKASYAPEPKEGFKVYYAWWD